MFRIKPTEAEHLIELEQAGPDVVVRLNGVGILTFQTNAGQEVGPELVVYQRTATEQGITMRIVHE